MKWVNFSIFQAMHWWSRLKGSGGIWRGFEGKDFQSFCESLHKSDAICELGFGVGRVTHLIRGHSCRVHGVFWSKDAYRHPEVVRRALIELFDRFDLVRIECVVPSSMRSLGRLLVKFGFVKEGTLRAIYKVDDRFFDGDIYSIVGGTNG